MLETAFPILEKLAEGIATKIFAAFTAESTKSIMSRMRRETAKRRAVTRVLESLDPFFSAELSEHEALEVANRLKERFDGVVLTPELVADHRFNIQSLHKKILSEEQHPAQESEIIRVMVDNLSRQVLQAAVGMMKILPDWERVAWVENFRAFDELNMKLERQSDLIREIIINPKNKVDAFEKEYRRHTAKDLGRVYIKGLGNVDDVRPLSLDSLFVMAGLKRSISESELRPNKEIPRDSIESAPIRTQKAQAETGDLSYVLAAHRQIVFLGAPGSGKSTLVQFTALRAALLDDEILRDDVIPFLLRVRSFGNFDQLPGPKDFVSFCAPFLDLSDAGDFTIGVFQKKRALLIVDGLDECEITVPEEDRRRGVRSEREKVISWIKSISEKFPGNRIILTSRPVGYIKGELSDAGFVEYEVLPLTVKQQELFVEHWGYAVELSISPNDPITATRRAEEVSRDLKLRIGNAKSVRALAHNPLMLSVICILHRYRGDKLPERKVDLMNECVNVLLYDWRSAQGIKRSVIGDLDARQLRALIQPLAWQMAVEGKEQVSEEELLQLFSRHLPEIQQPTGRASEVVSVIRDRTGVLMEVGPKIYSFMHLLFQEYLAAEECAASARDYDFLMENVGNMRWKEIIPMAVAASKGNQETLVRSLLEKKELTSAGLAMAMMDRVSIPLQREWNRELDAYCVKLCDDFSASGISALLDMGRIDAINAIIRILLRLKTQTTGSYLETIKKWDFKGSAYVSVEQLARNTAKRAIIWNEIDLSTRGLHAAEVGYSSDTDDVSSGATWSVGCLSMPEQDVQARSEDEETKKTPNDINDDPIYNYAVILDACELHRGYLAGVSWDAMVATFAEAYTSPEGRLLVLHFVWYHSIAEEKCEKLVEFLEAFPPNVCPAFQIGILNNAMSRLQGPMRERIRLRAEALWERAFAEMLSLIRELLVHWKDDFVIPTEEVVSQGTTDPLWDVFMQTLRQELDEKPIFPTADA